MKRQAAVECRKDLKEKMAVIFSENIKTLSPDIQEILLDDLVTALENRLAILKRVHQNSEFCIKAITESAEFETVET